MFLFMQIPAVIVAEGSTEWKKKIKVPLQEA